MKRFFLTLAVFGLLGCENTEQLQKQNKELRQQIDQQQGAKEAQLQFFERMANMAHACDFLIPLCPASTIETGREAITQGVSATGQGFLWLVILKFAGLAAIMGVLVGSWRWAWLNMSQPAARALDALQIEIKSKENDLEIIQREIYAAKAIEAKTRQEIIGQSQSQLQHLERQIAQKSKKHDEIESELATRTVELDALNEEITLKTKEKELLNVFGSSTRR
jgi:hypothetical protein